MIISLYNSNLFSNKVGLNRRFKNFIVKNTKVQCKSKPKWMSWRKFGIGNVLQKTMKDTPSIHQNNKEKNRNKMLPQKSFNYKFKYIL